MQEPVIFNQINVSPPLEDIYKRLGFRNGTTKISQERRKETEKIISDALAFIELKGCAGIFAVKKDADAVSVGNFLIKSRLLYSLLGESDEIFLCAATAGERIMEEIKRCSKNDLTRAVILDAVASEMTDACFDWMMNYYNRQLARENKRLTEKRISCGYADFAIENQKKIYSLLKLDKIGINITEQFMLIPEKSATAALGIIRL
jgi:hypothetical protein